MRKLLSAHFARLWHSKAFWIALLGVFVFSVATIWNGSHSAAVMAERGFVRNLDDYYFSQAPYMGMIFAVFTSLFLGTEYSDGTMRNKLVVGHTRAHVYLANFMVCFAVGVLLVAAWFLGCAPGLKFIGPFEMSFWEFAAYFLVAVSFTAAYTALYTWISMLCTNKALTVILTLGAWMALILIASGFNDRLLVPEMQGGMAFIDGEFVMVEPTPNPLYLSGTTRVVCEWILDFLPSGQAILMHSADIQHPVRQMLLALLFTGMFLITGIVSFRRKNIK